MLHLHAVRQIMQAVGSSKLYFVHVRESCMPVHCGNFKPVPRKASQLWQGHQPLLLLPFDTVQLIVTDVGTARVALAGRQQLKSAMHHLAICPWHSMAVIFTNALTHAS